jgi:DNA-binding MarR family transcriptional regulator
LERRGFILRNIDKADRRSVSIELTEMGMEALENANKELLNINERLVVSLGDTDTDKLIELIDKLTDIYKGMLEDNGDGSGE